MAVRIGFFFLAAGLVLWAIFISPLAVQIIHYAAYTNAKAPDEIKWTIIPIHSELWRPVAHFKYTVSGQKYEADEVFQGGLYRTPYAAEEAIKELKNNNPLVWYSPLKPSRGTLEKFFPLKRVIYAIITFFLVLYGAWLGYYLGMKWKH